MSVSQPQGSFLSLWAWSSHECALVAFPGPGACPIVWRWWRQKQERCKGASRGMWGGVCRCVPADVCQLGVSLHVFTEAMHSLDVSGDLGKLPYAGFPDAGVGQRLCYATSQCVQHGPFVHCSAPASAYRLAAITCCVPAAALLLC